MKRLQIPIIGICLAILSGCTTTPEKISVTYFSDPPGAMLYSGGRFMGVTPITLTYPQLSNFINGGCQRGETSVIRWGSGAEASFNSIRLCKDEGDHQQFIFQRPANVPGSEADIRFATELQRNPILREEAQAQRDAALIQAWEAINAANASDNAKCVSRVIGSRVQTDCE